MALSRDPASPEPPRATVQANVENALDFLEMTVPGFRSYVTGRVLDFGCGWGNQSVAMAKLGAARVVGLDIQWHARARRLAEEHGCADRVTFVERLPDTMLGTFDMALSCSSMEHFDDPEGVVRLMKQATRPGGRVIISFGEPWYGPRGSHFDHFSRLPWVNLLFSEQTVMRVRSHFRFDGAQRYCEVRGGLNQMSLARFERIVRHSGMEIEFLKSYMTKGLPVSRIPVVRELCASAAACVLRKR